MNKPETTPAPAVEQERLVRGHVKATFTESQAKRLWLACEDYRTQRAIEGDISDARKWERLRDKFRPANDDRSNDARA